MPDTDTSVDEVEVLTADFSIDTQRAVAYLEALLEQLREGALDPSEIDASEVVTRIVASLEISIEVGVEDDGEGPSTDATSATPVN